jgi:hypothetical protein
VIQAGPSPTVSAHLGEGGAKFQEPVKVAVKSPLRVSVPV